MSKDLVLVVDDELDNRVMMRYFLESWGYEVDLAANGQEALDKVDAKFPQLILLDLEMPVMDGFDTCDRLKSDEATEDIPVIMFTGLEQTADKVRGIRRGADDYVVKTVDPEELQARIEMILKRSKRYEARAAEPATTGGNGTHAQNGSAVSGSLSELYFPETMQLILAYGKSGVLNLRDEDRQGCVYIKGGKVVHATLGTLEGESAFYDLALWKSGTFSFQVGEDAPKETINKSGTNLLIEATRRLDEWNMISSKIPSFDVIPLRIPLAGASSIRLTNDDWKVLYGIDGSRSISQIAGSLQMDLFETGRIVFNLLTVSVVSLDSGKQEENERYQRHSEAGTRAYEKGAVRNFRRALEDHYPYRRKGQHQRPRTPRRRAGREAGAGAQDSCGKRFHPLRESKWSQHEVHEKDRYQERERGRQCRSSRGPASRLKSDEYGNEEFTRFPQP